MDIGAGEGKAILDYYGAGNESIEAQSLVNRAAKASCVAISIEDRRTEQWHRTAAAVDEHRLRYLFGRTFGEYSAAELGQFQVVTDVIGGFSYTPNLARFTQRALASLAPGGSFFTVLQDVHSEEGSNVPHYAGSPYLTEIIAPDGSKLKICAWLKRIGCVQVTCELRTGFIPPIEVYHIRKTCEDVTVPALATVHYTAGTPPERRFLLTDTPPAPAAETKPVNTPLREGVATPLR
jgi:SAM-dependent methyltransferase